MPGGEAVPQHALHHFAHRAGGGGVEVCRMRSAMLDQKS